ncbi:MAG: hypothetical protein LUQ60_06295 [Methanomicrobiales archaeon]|nr:hypothetical protein [Methanomicrobiales archaeon]
MPLLETVVYLVSTVLLFPAFGGGVWIIESALRQKTRLGWSFEGGTYAKLIAGTVWLGGFLVIVGVFAFMDSYPLFVLGIFVWEGIGLYGAYLWYQLQEILTVKELKVE